MYNSVTLLWYKILFIEKNNSNNVTSSKKFVVFFYFFVSKCLLCRNRIGKMNIKTQIHFYIRTVFQSFLKNVDLLHLIPMYLVYFMYFSAALGSSRAAAFS